MFGFSQKAVLLQVIISFWGEKVSLVMLKLMAGCTAVSGQLTGEHSCLKARRLYINSAPGLGARRNGIKVYSKALQSPQLWTCHIDNHEARQGQCKTCTTTFQNFSVWKVHRKDTYESTCLS